MSRESQLREAAMCDYDINYYRAMLDGAQNAVTRKSWELEIRKLEIRRDAAVAGRCHECNQPLPED